MVLIVHGAEVESIIHAACSLWEVRLRRDREPTTTLNTYFHRGGYWRRALSFIAGRHAPEPHNSGAGRRRGGAAPIPTIVRAIRCHVTRVSLPQISKVVKCHLRLTRHPGQTAPSTPYSVKNCRDRADGLMITVTTLRQDRLDSHFLGQKVRCLAFLVTTCRSAYLCGFHAGVESSGCHASRGSGQRPIATLPRQRHMNLW